eukprot:54640-Eustigmatos_ZCMA.PRE.1
MTPHTRRSPGTGVGSTHTHTSRQGGSAGGGGGLMSLVPGRHTSQTAIASNRVLRVRDDNKAWAEAGTTATNTTLPSRSRGHDTHHTTRTHTSGVRDTKQASDDPMRAESHITRSMRTRSQSLPPPAHDMHTAGLVNLGHTCFMNATLQCLAHHAVVRDFLHALTSEQTAGRAWLANLKK